jgi:prepilin-type N-terminal cleavage/methylation domain-containing protein
MANVTNSTLGFHRRSVRGSRGGFSLVEVLCVLAVISLLASMSWPSVVGMVSGNRLTNNAYQLSGIVQEAREAAMANHTYVWVGFYSSSTAEGVPLVTVATLVGNSGLTTDLSTGNYTQVAKPVILKNAKLAAATSYTTLPGVDSTDNTDAGTQSYTFKMAIPSNAAATFGDVIVFGPDGQASLPQTSTGALQLVQCIGLGLNGVPASGSHTPTAAIQVRGLSGQVSVFQQ